MTLRKALILSVLAVSAVVVAAASTVSVAAQEAVKPESLAGTWDVEIAAEGQYFYVTLVLECADGKPSGKISESTGLFTDAPCETIAIEGRKLSFSANLLSPPDGTVKLWKVEVEMAGDEMTGSIWNTDLALLASFAGKKAK